MENFFSDKAVVGRDGLMVVEKATFATVLVRSALLAAEVVDPVIVVDVVVVGYEADDYINNVKMYIITTNSGIGIMKPREKDEGHYSYGRIFFALQRIIITLSLTIDQKDNIDHVFDKETALTNQTMHIFSQQKNDGLRKKIDPITKIKKRKNIKNRLMVKHGFLRMERFWLNKHITLLKVLQKKHKDPVQRINQ